MNGTQKLIELLAQRELLPPEVLGRLREQLSAAGKPVAPQLVVKRLVESGHLTGPQGKRLLADVEAATGASSAMADRTKASPGKASPPRSGKAPRVTGSEAPASEKPTSGKPSSLLEEELGLDEGGDSGLDALMNDPSFSSDAAAGSPLQPVAKRRGLFAWLNRGRPRSGPSLNSKTWDSPVVLVSGGLLLLLVATGIGLWWSLFRQSGDEALAAADDDYRAGAYTQAISKYEQYLDRFGSHTGASHARVHRGLARLRQRHASAPGTVETLATARDVVDEISREEAFSEAAGELAAMLPEIAEGLARRAAEEKSAEALAGAEEALQMAGNSMYIPPAMQPESRLREIAALVEVARRAIDQQSDLRLAVERIEESVANGDPSAAYDVYFALLKQYPTLRDNAELAEAVKKVGRAQQSLVETSEAPLEAKQGLPPRAEQEPRALVATDHQKPAPLKNVDGKVFVAIVDGVTLGLAATDGSRRWQLALGEPVMDFVNEPVAVTMEPTSANGGSEAASGTLLLGSPRELWCLDPVAGTLVWRLELSAPATGPPRVIGRRALLSTADGIVWWVDLRTGDAVRRTSLKQPLSVPPAVDASEGTVYQVADHSNLFVLDGASGTCIDVIHLGHRRGTIRVGPTPVGSLLVLPINSGARSSVLHVLASPRASVAGDGPKTNANPQATTETSTLLPERLEVVQRVPFIGHFDRPITADGRRLVAVTDRGALRLMELRAGDPSRPLVPLIERAADKRPPLMRFIRLHEGRLLVAGRRLASFEVAASLGQLVPQWLAADSDTAAGTGQSEIAFLQPLEIVGDAVVHVRRQRGSPEVIVEATRLSDGNRAWRVRMGPPGRPGESPSSTSGVDLSHRRNPKAYSRASLPSTLSAGIVPRGASGRAALSVPAETTSATTSAASAAAACLSCRSTGGTSTNGEDKAEPAEAEEEKEPTPIHLADPFDRIVLDAETGETELLVAPLPFPNRRVSEDVPPRELLKFRLLDRPGEEYEVPWYAIERIDLYEQMVVAEARRLIAQRNFHSAYEVIEMLRREYPDLPELPDLFADFLYEEAKQAVRDGKYDLALARLRETHRHRADREGLEKALAFTVDKLAALHADRGRWADVRALTNDLLAWYPENDTGRRWQQNLIARAEKALEVGRAAADRGDWQAAAQAVRKAEAIWPKLPGLAELAQQAAERWPRVVVGVWRLDERRRTSRLLYRDYAELVTPGADGGNYRYPFGPVQILELGRGVELQMRPDVALGDEVFLRAGLVAQQLAALGNKNSFTETVVERSIAQAGGLTGPLWPELVSAVEDVAPDRVVVRFRRPHVDPRRLLQVPPGLVHATHEGSRQPVTDTSVIPRSGPYQRADTAEDSRDSGGQPIERGYLAREKYFAFREQQPREIVERAINPLRGLQLLMESPGQSETTVDLIERVPPWQLGRYRRAATDGRVVVREYGVPAVACLIPNLDRPLLTSRSFRRGLLFALDRQQITRQLTEDESDPARIGVQDERAVVLAAPIPDGYVAATDVMPRRFDPRMGLALIALGLRESQPESAPDDSRGDGPNPGGAAANDSAADDSAAEDPAPPTPPAPRTLVLGHPDQPVAAAACRAIADAWSRLQLEVELKPLPARSRCPLLGDVPRADVLAEVDLYYGELFLGEPVVDLVSLYGSRGLIDHGNPYVRLSARELAEAGDWSAAGDALRALHRILHEQLPVLPLWQLRPAMAHRPTLAGVGDAPVTLYQDVELWRREGVASAGDAPGGRP